MPKVPKHIWDNLKPKGLPTSTFSLCTNKYPTNSKNGSTKINIPSKLPHPFKCSKCNYIFSDKLDKQRHWDLEH